MLFAVFMIGSFTVLGLSYALWIGGWNVVARVLLSIIPSLDLRICQEWRTTVGRDGKTSKVPVHTFPQGVVFLVMGLGMFGTCCYGIGTWFTYLFSQ